MADADTLIPLLQATARGERPAFAELYRQASPHLYGLLLRMLRRRDWAEEALQDCFVRIWQKADTYAPEKGAPLTWMLTVARYRALDLLRMRRPEVSADGDAAEQASRLPDPGLSVEALASQSQELGRLRGCLDQLPQEQRRGVLLSYYEGYTHSELVVAMEAPLGTVKSWVRRGLQRLRECLEP